MDKFDTLVALVFGHLYSSFPEPIRLNPDDFFARVISETDEDGAFNFSEYCWHTVNWLIAEGYIRVTRDFSSLDGTSYEVVLSQKGLESLRKVPSSLQGSATVGERLVAFSKAKGSEAVGTLISFVINTAGGAIAS